MLRLDEHATFNTIQLADGTKEIGHFRLDRAIGSLAYAPTLFVVADDGRVWPMSVVVCLYANDAPTATGGRNRADRLAR